MVDKYAVRIYNEDIHKYAMRLQRYKYDGK